SVRREVALRRFITRSDPPQPVIVCTSVQTGQRRRHTLGTEPEEESIGAVVPTRARGKSIAGGTAGEGPAPDAGRMRNGTARVCAGAIHAEGSPSSCVLSDGELHLADHGDRRLRLSRGRTDR